MNLIERNTICLIPSKKFSEKEVKTFEKTVNYCVYSCNENCKGRKLAKYLAKVGLDEFVHQKDSHTLPEDILDAFSCIKLALIFSTESECYIYRSL